MSVGDLVIDKQYTVEKFTRRDTEFGPAILCALYSEEEGAIEVFLPKSVTLTENDITEYNNRSTRDMYLLYLGKRGRAFLVTFGEY